MITPHTYFYYKITNTLNGKSYIGFGTDPKMRWREHKRDAENGDSSVFHTAIREDGWKNFHFEVICCGRNKQFLLELRPLLIEQHRSTVNQHGYNTMSHISYYGSNIGLTKKERNKKYNQSEKGQLRNKEGSKKYRQSDKYKQTHALRQRRYFESVKGRALQLWTSAQQRTKLKNLPFTITREWIEDKLTKSECEVTGTPLNFDLGLDVQQNPFAPSIDQKIPSKGYTFENTQIVAVWYNRMKSDLTDDMALQILIESHAGILEKYRKIN